MIVLFREADKKMFFNGRAFKALQIVFLCAGVLLLFYLGKPTKKMFFNGRAFKALQIVFFMRRCAMIVLFREAVKKNIF